MRKDFESPFISQHVSQLISSNLVVVYIELIGGWVGLGWIGSGLYLIELLLFFIPICLSNYLDHIQVEGPSNLCRYLIIYIKKIEII